MSRNRYDQRLDRAFYAKGDAQEAEHAIIKERFAECERDIRAGKKLARRLDRLAKSLAQLKRYIPTKGRPRKVR